MNKISLLKGFDRENYLNFDLDEDENSTQSIKEVSKSNFTDDSTELLTIAPSRASNSFLPTFSEEEIPSTIFGYPSIIKDANTHVLVVSILIGLIVLLTCILVVLAIPLLRDMIRRHMPLDNRRRKRRLITVEEWLITKVRMRDEGIHGYHIIFSNILVL